MQNRFSANGKAKPQKLGPTQFEVRSNALRRDRGATRTPQWSLARKKEKKVLARQQPRLVYYTYGDDNPHPDPDHDDGLYSCFCIGTAKYAGKWALPWHIL